MGHAEAQEDWRAVCPSSFEASFPTCILKFAGAKSTEQVQAEDEQLVRVFIYKDARIDSPILIVEAALSKAGGARLVLRDPMRKNVSRVYPFERSSFDMLVAKVDALRFDGAVLHGVKSSPESLPVNTICLHPASAFVEIIRDGGSASTEMGYCSNEDATFLESFLQLAASVEPACVKASREWYADALRECLYNAQ